MAGKPRVLGLRAERLDLDRGPPTISVKEPFGDLGVSPLGVVVKLAGANDPRASLAPLVALVEEDMAHVNRIILDRARSNVELIPELARHLIAALESGKKILFSSNHAGSHGFNFNLFMVNLDGSGLEQITFDPVFDAFPMFSYDGKKLIFSSNRNNGGTRDTNVFVADWVE